MASIRSSGTKPELEVVAACRIVRARTNRRFKLNVRSLPGKPDVVFPRSKIAIFVNGCFWHSHSCANGRVKPKSNSTFWSEKRRATVERDERKAEQLRQMGFSVRVVWECETSNVEAVASLIETWIRLN